MKEEIKKSDANWESLSKSYELSGKTQKEFCKEEGLELSKFKYHHQRLKNLKRNRSKSEVMPVMPIKLHHSKPQQKDPVQVTLPNGYRVNISEGADLDYFQKLLRVLLSC